VVFIGGNAMNNEALRLMSIPAMQEKFREAMGPWQDGDWGLSIEEGEPGICIDAEFINAGERNGAQVPIRLPIDPNNPERGCWFMLTRENRNDKIFLNKLAESDNP
jgi:hypothetical protein